MEFKIDDNIIIKNICCPTNNINYINLPVNEINDSEVFNKIVNYYKSKSYFTPHIQRTSSNGISINNLKYLPAFDVFGANIGAELIVLADIEDGGFYRLQYRPCRGAIFDDLQVQISGIQAIHKFEKDLRNYKIKLSDYYIDNGAEVKKTIPTYKIELLDCNYKDICIRNAHHVDMHSSFPYGLAKAYPEFEELIKIYYKNRKTNPQYKLILNSMIGAMQSLKYFKAKLAHMSKVAISTNNDRLDQMVQYLRDTGRTPILLNTDGVWFTGESTGLKGKELGDWEEDHTDCVLRIKSKGSYEYIENGKYYPVVRGHRKLDDIKPRTEWEFGDIYDQNSELICKEFVDEDSKNIIKEYVDEEKL